MKRPRLKSGDKVKVVTVPESFKRWLGRVGEVSGVRGPDRMWHVRFRRGWSEFHRHELELEKEM